MTTALTLAEPTPCSKCGADRVWQRCGMSSDGKIKWNLKCTPCEKKRKAKYYAKHGYGALNLRYKTRNPEKKRAHRTVQKGRKAGKIERRPCERCGTTTNVDAHHDDYSRPFDVMWLCRLHHAERHRELRLMVSKAAA